MNAPLSFELAHRAPTARSAGLIAGMTGYREHARGRFHQCEAAPLVMPLIISLGSPFLIALGECSIDLVVRKGASSVWRLSARQLHLRETDLLDDMRFQFAPAAAEGDRPGV